MSAPEIVLNQSITLKGLAIHYRDVGEGKPIVLLHGWGSRMSVFSQLERFLAPNFRVLSLDLPGFGGSEKPHELWALNDYVALVQAFFDHFGLDRPWVLGHSFGGRIAIVLGAKGLASKLVLAGAAGVKPRRPLSYYLKVYSYKLAKQILRVLPESSRESCLNRLRQGAGSADYRNADPVMRGILVKVVNEDLTGLLPDIKVPTLLIWGEHDDATPLYQAKIMEKAIADSGLVVLKKAGHYCFMDKPHEFNLIADHFFKA